MAVHGCDWTTDAVEVGRTRTTDAAVGRQRNLVLNALSDWQPVQCITKHRSDVLVESSASDEARSSGVQYRLQTPNSICQCAIQDRIAIIHLAVNQHMDDWMKVCNVWKVSDQQTERSCRIW